MFKILSTAALILLILLTPPAVLALITQDALPNDHLRYPIKRKLEDGVLVLASVTPLTKAWFSVARSERRFQEASALLDKGSIPQDLLNELVIQTDVAAKEIEKINNLHQKRVYLIKLAASIDKYDQGLSKEEEKLALLPPAVTPTQSTPPNQTSGQPQPTPQPTSENQQRIIEVRQRLDNIKQEVQKQQQQIELQQSIQQNSQKSAPSPSPTPPPQPENVSTPLNQPPIPTTAAPLRQTFPLSNPTPTPYPTIQSTPTPFPSSQATCYDNYPPVTYQANPAQGYQYYWKADCSKSCTQNSQCPQNTSDPLVEPSTSNWCYEGHCYMFKTRSI